MPPNRTFGNLQSYRSYTQPMAKRLFGDVSFRKKRKSQHQENVQKILEHMALHGSLTTWEMAKLQFSDTPSIRTREKEIRRLLIGRKDRGKKSPGVLDVGLVVSKKTKSKQESNSYRLSLHGILYCLDVMSFSHKEIDTMASHYSKILPMVFGKWDYLKSIIGNDIYRIKILAEGLFLDNIHITKISKIPIFEIITYLNVKYQDFYESIDEKMLAEQISYWFYTIHLIPSTLSKKTEKKELNKWKKIFGDKKLNKWYFDFIEETSKFYSDRFNSMKILKD